MTRGTRFESPFHRQPLSAKISLSNLSLPASFSARISCSQNLTLSVSWLASLAADLSRCQPFSASISPEASLSLRASLSFSVLASLAASISPGTRPSFHQPIRLGEGGPRRMGNGLGDLVANGCPKRLVIRHCSQQSSPRSCEVCLGSCVVMWYGGKRSVGVQVLLLIHCRGRSWRAL